MGEEESSAATPTSLDPAALHKQVLRLLGLLKQVWRQTTMYPVGHPILARSLEGALAAVHQVLTLAGRLELTAVEDRLLVGESSLDEKAVVAREFAGTLRRRGVRTLTVLPGLTVRELEQLLRILAKDPREVFAEGGGAALVNGLGSPRLQAVGLRYDQEVLAGETLGEEALLEEDADRSAEDELVKLQRLLADTVTLDPKAVDKELETAVPEGAQLSPLDLRLCALLREEGARWSAADYARLRGLMGDTEHLGTLVSEAFRRAAEEGQLSEAELDVLAQRLLAQLSWLLKERSPEAWEQLSRQAAQVILRVDADLMVRAMGGETRADLPDKSAALDEVVRQLDDGEVAELISKACLHTDNELTRLGDLCLRLTEGVERLQVVAPLIRQKLRRERGAQALCEQVFEPLLMELVTAQDSLPREHEEVLRSVRGMPSILSSPAEIVEEASQLFRHGADKPKQQEDVDLLLALMDLEDDLADYRRLVASLRQYVDELMHRGKFEVLLEVLDRLRGHVSNEQRPSEVRDAALAFVQELRQREEQSHLLLRGLLDASGREHECFLRLLGLLSVDVVVQTVGVLEHPEKLTLGDVIGPLLQADSFESYEGSPRFLPMVSNEMSVRRKCVELLAELRASTAVPALVALAAQPSLKSEVVPLRREAIASLGKIGDPSAIPALLKLLDHRTLLRQPVNDMIRTSAALALGSFLSPQFGPEAKRVRAALKGRLKDRRAAVRYACLQTLRESAAPQPGDEP